MAFLVSKLSVLFPKTRRGIAPTVVCAAMRVEIDLPVVEALTAFFTTGFFIYVGTAFTLHEIVAWWWL